MNIIFDLDGTIGNTLPLCITAFREAIEPLTKTKLSDDDIINQFGPTEEGTIMALAPDHYDQAFKQYIDTYKRLHVDYDSSFDRIPEILELLKKSGVYIGLVTGKGEISTKITLEQYNLTHYFECIKTGSEKGPVKKERLEEVITEVGAPKENFLYIGDTTGDIDACRSVGIKIASAAWAETAEVQELKSKSPDYIFESTHDFESFIKNKI